jgi:hypothetical protein
MTYHRVFNKNNTTGATSGAGTAYYSSLRGPSIKQTNINKEDYNGTIKYIGRI